MSISALIKRCVIGGVFVTAAIAPTSAEPLFGRISGPPIKFMVSLGVVATGSCSFDTNSASVDFGDITLTDIANANSAKLSKEFAFTARSCSMQGGAEKINIDLRLMSSQTANWNGTPIIGLEPGTDMAEGVGIALYKTNGVSSDPGTLLSTNTDETYPLTFEDAQAHPENAVINLRATLEPLSTDEKQIVLGSISARAWLTMTYL